MGATEQEVADVLGNSAEIVRKHYAKWSQARQKRSGAGCGRGGAGYRSGPVRTPSAQIPAGSTRLWASQPATEGGMTATVWTFCGFVSIDTYSVLAVGLI
jgi:hypothetical protein